MRPPGNSPSLPVRCGAKTLCGAVGPENGFTLQPTLWIKQGIFRVGVSPASAFTDCGLAWLSPADQGSVTFGLPAGFPRGAFPQCVTMAGACGGRTGGLEDSQGVPCSLPFSVEYLS